MHCLVPLFLLSLLLHQSGGAVHLKMKTQSTMVTWRRTAFAFVALVASLIHAVSASSNSVSLAHHLVILSGTSLSALSILPCLCNAGLSNTQETSFASTLNANKAGAIFTFLGASAAGVWLPFFIPVNPEILKFGVLFSAGLFIYMALLELSREAYEEMEQATGSSKLLWYWDAWRETGLSSGC